MATTNTKTKHPYVSGTPTTTFEGAPAIVPEDKELLRRLVLSCFLWENNFYVNGKEVANQIAEVAGKVAKADPNYVRSFAIEARQVHNLRHAPLWVLVALAKVGKLTADTVYSVVSRPDEMGEILSQYWKANGRSATATTAKKISKQLQLGLAQAFTKFDAYQLAKWDQDKDISLKDILFLTHPKPKDTAQAALWKKLVDGTLESPDTWEVGLSAGKDKKETFERLLRERKLGYQALLMNLRNMREAKVDENLIFDALRNGAGRSRILPFQFLTAAKYNPEFESVLEEAMFKSLEGMDKISGTTVLLVDVSGSMQGSISDKSNLTRLDAASALAMQMREVCENVKIFRFDDRCEQIADRRGFALRDAIGQPRGGTNLGQALNHVKAQVPNADRVIVFTDEQSHDSVGRPAKKGYIMNVASYQRGVGYDTNWIHVNGFSDALVKFVHELESN